MKTFEDVAKLMDDVFSSCRELRIAGQKEYAGGENALGNFDRLAVQLQTTPDRVLWTYMVKHLDGILSYINGHKSQREDVRGRIKDVIVYMILLHAIFDEAGGVKTIPERSMEARPFGLGDIKKLSDKG